MMLLRQGASDFEALMAALVSHQIGRGHTCLSLVELATDPQRTLDIPPAQWEARNAYLMHSSALMKNLLKPTELLCQVLGENDLKQLSTRWLEQARQGQTCAWQPEQKAKGLHHWCMTNTRNCSFCAAIGRTNNAINHWLYERMQRSAEQVDAATIKAIVERLIPDVTEHPSWQRIACANAAQQSFSVITGGPGTGKTYTVLRVLATLSELHRVTAPERTLRIALAAPTGKAAARMQESISQSLQEPNLTNLISCKQFCQQKHRPYIACSARSAIAAISVIIEVCRYLTMLVVIDEASMIDTEMFDALLDALAPSTRLILLGDKDQLAPVEAGSILAALCQGAEQGWLQRFPLAMVTSCQWRTAASRNTNGGAHRHA